MPGFDPILDGTATPADTFYLTTLKNSAKVMVLFPDGETATYENEDAAQTAIAQWEKS